jgi:hypothetical protein
MRPEPEAETADKPPAGNTYIPAGEIAPDISHGTVPGEPPSHELAAGASRAPVSSDAKLGSVRPESVKKAEPERFQPDWHDPLDQQWREDHDAAENTNELAPGQPPQVTANQAERSSSRAFTDKDPDTVSGENLSFDFTDEEPAPDQARLARRGRGPRLAKQAPRESARWQVGDDDSTHEVEALIERRLPGEGASGRRSRSRLRAEEPEPQFTDGGFDAEEEVPVYNRAMTHSARFFVLLVFLVGVGFGAMTLLIHTSPGRASAVLSSLPVIGDRFIQPDTPAKLVALRDVNAVYQQGKEGRKALLISGTAENVSTESLRLVQLTAAIHDAQGHSLASQAVYCGNNVSAGMVGQMTSREIEFFQKLEPAKTFALEPSASCRFVAVFMNLPGTARAYDVAVSQAVAGTAQSAEEPGP